MTVERTEEKTRPGRYRVLVLSVLLLIMIVGSLDRVLLPVLLVDNPFLLTMGIADDPTAQGLLITIYALSYAFANVFFGPVGDVLGGKRMLGIMTVAWGVLAFFMGSIGSYGLMAAGRIARGAAQGPQFPMMNRLVKNWFPPGERGRANSVWLTGTPLASGLTVPIFAFIVVNFGWRSSFFLIGIATLLIPLPFIIRYISDKPLENSRVGESERDLINSENALLPSGPTPSFRKNAKVFMLSFPFWLAVAFHTTSLAINWGMFTWLPRYLTEGRGFSLGEMGILASLPFFASAGSVFFLGMLSDRFERRAGLCITSMLGFSVCITATAFVPDAVAAAILITVAAGFWGLGMPNFYAILQKIVPSRVMGTGSGVDNGIANLGSSLTPAIIGFTVAGTGGYITGLLFLAVVGLLGALAMLLLALKGY